MIDEPTEEFVGLLKTNFDDNSWDCPYFWSDEIITEDYDTIFVSGCYSSDNEDRRRCGKEYCPLIK